jgi:hypothetical protein
MIVLTSAAVAIAAAAAMAGAVLSLTRHAATMPVLMPLLPELAVVALGVYALCAVVLTAANLVGLSLLLRRHFARTPAHRGPAGPDWTTALAAGGLRRLAPLPVAPQPRPARPDGTVVLRRSFRPEEARREVARLCYIWAARTHFFSALIALVAAVALGAAQQHGSLPVVAGPIPTAAAGLIAVGLILLAVLARLAIDVSIDPLIDAMARFPAEPVETALLRRAVELLEAARSVSPERGSEAPAAAMQIPARLAGALEEGQRALSEAIERLVAATDGLSALNRSSLEALDIRLHAAEQRQPLPGQPALADAGELSQLREAVVALTDALHHVPAPPIAAGAEAAIGTDVAVRRQQAQPALADELKRLLQEIATTP